MKYKFKAQDIKTGQWVYGDLAYAEEKTKTGYKEKPMIMKHSCHGGMIYITSRYFVDENTIELVPEY